MLSALPDENPFGIFVWSFEESPQTEGFLREVCRYVLGHMPEQPGSLLHELQQGLRADRLPHLFILDGLDAIQTAGVADRMCGRLEDPLVLRFLRWLASGRDTRAKALVTTRYPLPELTDWGGRGFRAYELEDLDPPSARAVLRRRNVLGNDAALDALAATVNRHALTVDVLGLYLARFANGDPRQAAAFDLKSFASDQKAERLNRVLESYAARLPDPERDLLARLAVFPRGATADDLVTVIGEGGPVAGSLVGYNRAALDGLLQWLRDLRVVTASHGRDETTYAVHPFVRDFFRTRLNEGEPERIHDAMRRHLAGGLEEQPANRPTDPAVLNRYERLIEFTRLAGRPEAALDLFWTALGGYEHLGGALPGDKTRGLRILSGFSTDGTPARIDPRLPDEQRAWLAFAWGLFAQDLGDLATARQAYTLHREFLGEKCEDLHLAYAYQSLSFVERPAGRWVAARDAARAALDHAERANHPAVLKTSHLFLTDALIQLGELEAARLHLSAAAALRTEPAVEALQGLWEAEFEFLTGNLAVAGDRAANQMAVCRAGNWNHMAARCEVLLGRCAVSHDTGRSRDHLAAARAYAERSGDVNIALSCHSLAASIARRERDREGALVEAAKGIELAHEWGFNHYAATIRLELARIHSAFGQFGEAIAPAEWARQRAQEPDCQNAWVIADGLHWLGVAWSRSKGKGNKARARGFLESAVFARRRLAHPELAETEAELAKVSPH